MESWAAGVYFIRIVSSLPRFTFTSRNGYNSVFVCPAIQEFRRVNDSTMVACEVPIYLTAENNRYFQRQGFHLPLPAAAAPITGHIDLVQIRNRLIQILHYKPDAHKIQPVSQLVTCALALASLTKLPLKIFKCATSTTSSSSPDTRSIALNH